MPNYSQDPTQIPLDRRQAVRGRPPLNVSFDFSGGGQRLVAPPPSVNPFAAMLTNVMGAPPAPPQPAQSQPVTASPQAIERTVGPAPQTVVQPALPPPITSNFVDDPGTGGSSPGGGTPPSTPPTTPPSGGGTPPNPPGGGAPPNNPPATPPADGGTEGGGRRRAVGRGANLETIYGFNFADWQAKGGSRDEYDKFLDWMSDGDAKYGKEKMQPYATVLTRAPGLISDYYAEMDQAAKAGFTGIHFVDWLANERDGAWRHLSPLAGQFGETSATNAAKWEEYKKFGPSGNPNDPENPNRPVVPTTPPPPTPPPAPPTPPAPPAPTPPVPPPGPPAPTTPPVVPPVNNGDPTLPNFEELLRRQISEYEKGVNPLFQQQRDDIARRTAHAGALSGAINSGGYGETLNDALSKQYAQEQSTVAPEITKMSLAAQANALQKFAIDTNAILEREKIRSNFDLETAAQQLQRYGIDKNDLLDRYKAELGLKGVQYSADRQVDAAALQAAAAHAAAAASAEASKYAADLRFQSDIFGGDITRENNIMNYMLGIASLGPEWAKLILGSDPFGFMTGNVPPGSTTVRP